MRKVYMSVTFNVIVRVDDDVDISEAMEELSVVSTAEGVTLEDASVDDFEITDSK